MGNKVGELVSRMYWRIFNYILTILTSMCIYILFVTCTCMCIVNISGFIN